MLPDLSDNFPRQPSETQMSCSVLRNQLPHIAMRIAAISGDTVLASAINQLASVGHARSLRSAQRCRSIKPRRT